MIQYNLSIMCVDGDTIYGIISSDKKLILGYIEKYDHEGSSVNLVRRNDDSTFTEIEFDSIIEELEK